MELIIDYDMKDSSIEIVRLTLWRSAIMPDWASRWLLMLRPLDALQPPTEVFSQGDDHDHGGESALEIFGEVFGRVTKLLCQLLTTGKYPTNGPFQFVHYDYTSILGGMFYKSG